MTKILITGVSGLLGRRLAALLGERGDEVVGLVREGSRVDIPTRHWSPATGNLEAPVVSGFDAVVHLAGENIGEGRWTKPKKKKIYESRVQGTALLCEALVRAPKRPEVLVSASAVGYYGHRGDDILSEEASQGTGFLADVVGAWEEATEPARSVGIAVVLARLGPVLSTQGGALAKMLPPFKMGLGGVVGPGDQYMSWVAIDDVASALCHLIDHGTSLAGPINVAAPNPVTNRDFTHALGRVIHRPTAIPLPAMAARLALGEMADELLLVSQRLSVGRLLDSGFVFRYPELQGALEHIISSGG